MSSLSMQAAVSGVPRLQVDDLVAEAVGHTGLDDFGSPLFWPALEALTAALNAEARLSPAGWVEARRTIVRGLVNRLYLGWQSATYPEISQLPINGSVFIVGLPRTGSSFVHNLLAQHPDLRAPRLWELRNPVSPPGVQDSELLRTTQRFIEEYHASMPQLEAIIFRWRPDGPGTCTWLLINEFRNDGFGISYRVPSYAAWLLEHDVTDAYQGHRGQLQHILWRHPGATPILKCASHILHLHELTAVYPTAQLIILHRDPIQAVASACSLTAHVRRSRSDVVHLIEIGRQIASMAEQACVRLLEFRARPTSPGGVIDVRYGDLLIDPAAVARQIFSFLGLPVTPTVMHAIDEFVSQHPQHKHGVHTYDAARFGLDSAALAPRFAAYRAIFLD